MYLQTKKAYGRMSDIFTHTEKQYKDTVEKNPKHLGFSS